MIGMATFNSYSCGNIDETSLRYLSLPELAAVYKEITGKAIDKNKVGVDVVTLALKEKLKPPPPENPKRKRFNAPPRATQRKFPPNHKRAKLIALLSRPEGATRAECGEALNLQGKPGALQGMIRLLNTELGYGLREGDDGRIRLYV